jgi:hypothetical protein
MTLCIVISVLLITFDNSIYVFPFPPLLSMPVPPAVHFSFFVQDVHCLFFQAVCVIKLLCNHAVHIHRTW